ncbi:MAG: mandelate racemase/muconate lactonizing enzyme family protein [Planctomycetota bacterium]|nr:mandelate racemase/muconate lactonizing enzyme family protein [Planctomycetota bacterium]
MKITRLETFTIGEGPDVDPDKGGIEPIACIRVHTDEGIAGLSEVFRVPPGVVHATVGGPDTHFGRLLLGEEITHPERLWQKVWDSIIHTNRRGWQVIILGALDVAIWDIYGQALGEPVHQLLGGVERGPFQTHADSRVDTVVPYCTIVSEEWGNEQMVRQQAERAAQLAELGYKAFKAEPMMSTPELVVKMAREVRQAIGPDLTLSIDVGYLFNDVPTAAKICRQLEESDVFFFETPFPVDVPEVYARLASQCSIPLAMGEHGVTRWEFQDMMDRGGVTVCQPYMTTCGGLTEAKRIVDLAVPRGALVCPGNWSTQILGAATVHLAAYSPVTPFVEFAPAEIFESPLRLALQEAGHPVVNGEIALPTSPGIGYKLPDSIVKDFSMD